MPLKEMREELTCPICMELFTQPRRLPCGHSYCHLCIKAILDKKTEESGSYLNYSRTLVCPECREEIKIDFVRGIEGIPTDFKLSKLVELFQFIKANEDSDSGDELNICKSFPCGTTTDSSLVLPGPLVSLPTTTHLIPSETTPISSSNLSLINNSVRTPDRALEGPSADNNIAVGQIDASCQLVVERAETDLREDTQRAEDELGAVGGAPLSTNSRHEVSGVYTSSTSSAAGCVKQSSNNPDNIHGDRKRPNQPDQINHHGISLSSTCLATPPNDLIDQDHANDNRSVRAQSVPVDNFRLEEPRGAHSKHLKAKRRVKQRNIFFSDSSSDSSSSSSQERRTGPEQASTTGKNKRWLMTRFLRSIIFSDSSSSDDSDTDKTSVGKKTQISAHPSARPPGVTTSDSPQPSATSSSSHQPSATNSSSHQPIGASSSSRQPFAASSSSPQPIVASSSNQTSAESALPSVSQVRGSHGVVTATTDILLVGKAGRTARTSDYLDEQGEYQPSPSPGVTPPPYDRRELGCPHQTGHTQLLDSRVQTPPNSNTLLKEPAGPQPHGSRLMTRESTIRPEHFEIVSLDRSAEVLPTLYDNLNCSACLSDSSLPSVYDNTAGLDTHDHRAAQLLVRDPNFNPCQQDSSETDLPHFSGTEPRTLYDNIDDSQLVLEGGVPVSPTYQRRQVQTRNLVTEIEELKTGYEHLSPSSDGNASQYSVLVALAGEYETPSNIDKEIPSSVSSVLHRDPDVVQGGRCFSELSDNAQHSAHLATPRALPENSDNRMSLLNTNSSSMGATLATREGTSTGSNLQLIAPGEQQQNPSGGRVDIADDEFEFVENYFDSSSEEACGKNLSHINLAPSCFAIDAEEPSETSSSPVTNLAKKSPEPVNGAAQNNNNNVKDSSEEEEEEEDENAHPGTSMLHNKKKPRSRLKKFLTSLLSLSSSDEDDENFEVRTSSSSKSSDW